MRGIVRIGVLALQGAFLEHVEIIRKLGVEPVEVRLPRDVTGLDGLIIPGGESTTILKLMNIFGLEDPLKERISAGWPVWGTCAGMICLARKVDNTDASPLSPMAVMDIEVRRNAFGRQVDSFETDLSVPVLGQRPFHAVFIRAPWISQAGSRIQVLASLADGTIVAAQQGNILVTSFHPELTEDLRFHQYFLSLAGASKTPAQTRVRTGGNLAEPEARK